MADYNHYAQELKKYGIHHYISGKRVIPLDKVFGLDPNKHNDGLNEYGVSNCFVTPQGVSVTYYQGDIRYSTNVYTQGETNELPSKRSRWITPKEEEGVKQFLDNLLAQRKEQIKVNQYWIEHFNDFLANALKLAQADIKNRKKTYTAKLAYGSTIADPREGNAILICDCGGHQVGYIKITQNRFGDIEFDSCCFAHTEWTIKDPNNIEKDIKSACAWIC